MDYSDYFFSFEDYSKLAEVFVGIFESFMLNFTVLVTVFYASMLISKKAGELFSKAIKAKSDWTDKDDLLDVIYWFKQIFSLLFGIVCGLLPVEGFSVIAFYLMVSTLVTHFYITAFQCFDEDELGGISEIFKEGFSSAFATFMVCWIVAFTYRSEGMI
ncbi:Uncharacterized protein T4B_8082 [Trichinella pseudospiralis]|uniref:Rab5-interacting protein n=1 Tax=Trichinella pseudospiralis TaxID=6337 RepID=A0A0V1JDD8_TRIPS|nr:Uncharacterized protein T4B_8082 [Trichinella pseudospiralis]